MDNLVDFEKIYIKKVTFHPYRTARVFNRFLSIKRNSNVGKELENKLAKMAGTCQDNHSVYSIQLRDEQEIHVWCTDSEIMFGLELKIDK